jgi:hypothetical protein
MENMKGKHMIDTNRRVYVYFNLHKKVLREQKKNVHAGVSGYIVERVPNVPDFCTTVHYNPYKNETFISHATERPMLWAPHVVMECRDGKTNVEAVFDNHKDVLKSR